MKDTVSDRTGNCMLNFKSFALFSVVMLSLVSLCFCTLFPAAVFLSFLFNGIWLGSSLFASLAQEREKRTIDALRLTQLSSLDILLLKSRRELKLWKWGNLALAGLLLLTGAAGQEPLLWVLSGAAALAAGGLLSIALALAVSTRSETTSSAVVTGWVSKGVWLAGLPLLDQVLEAVFVMKGPLHLLRFLDPAWVAYRVGEASFFEINGLTAVGLWLGAAATVATALALVVQSSRLIDTSFEVAGTLEDRDRHPVYRRKFFANLHNNPFFLRELAWQLRSGAGRWPGYAVFLTLFLAPFMYGVAQQQKAHQPQPVRVVRHDVVKPVSGASHSTTSTSRTSTQTKSCGFATSHQTSHQSVEARRHGHLCLSRAMGLPVDRYTWNRTSADTTIVMTASGNVETVSHKALERMTRPEVSVSTSRTAYKSRVKSVFERELGRGLLTGLLLAVIYLFVRGGAFMAGAVTGERERRAWDQIALTGARPRDFLLGKLAGVLTFPVRQLLFCSPALGLFAVFGVINPFELVLVVALLLACFAAAGTLGLAASTMRPNSHQAQGFALASAAVLLALPLSQLGWLPVLGITLIVLGRTQLDAGTRALCSVAAVGTAFLFGSALSPIGAVLALCGSSIPLYGAAAKLGAWAMLLGSTLWMSFLAWMFYQVAEGTLEDGGSVQA